jgi:hypothetical protein
MARLGAHPNEIALIVAVALAVRRHASERDREPTHATTRVRGMSLTHKQQSLNPLRHNPPLIRIIRTWTS